MSEPGDPAFAPTVGSDPAHAPTLATSPRDATVTLKLGERLGDRYIVRAFLGEGGMGAVYRAFDDTLGEEVALKVVRGTLGESTQLRDEVRIAQQVTHRNVCRTYDLEDVAGFHLIKMEFVDGETLAHVIARDHRLDIARAIEVARGIAEGLAAAHARGIVHRDLKPGNVMLAGDRVVLMDFGLAQRAGEAEIAGTPGYMAPEQLAGGTIDARADLYALGCVVYEMLVGEPVFAGARSLELHAKHLTTPAPSVRAKRGQAPRWLARAVAELLAKAPPARDRGLRRLVTGPRRWPLAVGATLAIAATATAIVVATRAPAWAPDVRAIEPVLDEDAGPPRISPDGKQLAFWASRGTETDSFGYVMPITGGMPIRVPGSVSVVEWARERGALLTSLNDRLVRVPVDGTAPTLLGTGAHAVVCGPDAIATSVNDNSGFRVTLAVGDHPAHDLYRAPIEENLGLLGCDASGQRMLIIRTLTFASATRGDLWIVERDGRARQLTSGNVSGTAAFTPDGSVVAAMRRGDDVQLYEIASTGGSPRQLTFDDGPNVDPDVTPDGERLVFNRKTFATTIAIGGAGPVSEVPARVGVLAYPVATRRGDVVVAQRTTGAGEEIVRIGLRDGAEQALAPGSMPFVSFDGTRVFFVAPDDRRRLLAIPIDGGAVTTVATLPNAIAAPGYADADAVVHLWLDREHVAEGWHVMPDGRIESDGVGGLLRPAPGGGWRAVERADAEHLRVTFFGPGRPLSAPSRELVVDSVVNTWVDDHRFGYVTADGFHVLDLASGTDTSLGGKDFAWLFAQVAADGQHWFSLARHGHTARRVIVNFGARPWRRSF